MMANSSGTQDGWVVKKLSDVLVLHYGKALKKEDRRDGPFPVFGSSGVVGSHDVSLAKGPGVIVGRKGNVGSVFWSDSDFFVIDTAYYVTSSLPLRFLYYLLPTLNFINGDAAVPGLSRNQAYSLDIRLPPLRIQRRIAGILSAYDELIENSQRRIKILEAMARGLYREWFVHFRFPGHESVPRVPSPLSEIPQGWEVKKLGDVAEVNRAQINARTAPEELHYIDISSVSPGQIDSITTYAFADAPGRARRIVQHGDVLWSCVRPSRRSYAQVMHPERNTIASTGFAILTARTVPFTFLYFATTTDDFVTYLTNNATGAAYPAVTAPAFEKANLLIPPAPLLKQFGDVTIAMVEQIHTLQRQIQNLRRTRDLLLPRLLSGQINVEATEA